MVKTGLIAFVAGFLAVAALLYGISLALTVLADLQGWGSFRIGGGPFVVFEYVRTPTAEEALYGIGIVTIAALAGLLNALVALLMQRRRS